ncbi:MAG: FMN-binding protein [Lachnospiraceae bacterium]|nr:FMN-binding protein [Lachnospiraceae bacterium]MDD3614855.1 FMN-binding protein [Lachnospiraceae bacterium]
MEWLKKTAGFAPILSTVFLTVCVGVSLKNYTRPIYEVNASNMDSTVQEQDVQDNSDDEQETETETETAEAVQVSTGAGSFDLEDGSYEGTGTGFAGSITVSVTVKDKKITAIDVLNVEADDAAFFNRAKGVIDKIISAQSLEVDVVSGATYSSNGIISAVKNALTGTEDTSQPAASSGASTPSAGSSNTITAVQDPAAYRDGTYTGTGTGFAGPLSVQVAISGGKISKINITNTSDGSSYIQRASGLINNIIAAQSTNVDTVSGATYSSVGIIEAVRNALSQAAVTDSGTSGGGDNLSGNNQNNSGNAGNNNSQDIIAGKFPYTDGIYYGTAEGYLSDITVALVLQDKTIKAILITEQEDDEIFFNRAKAVVENVMKTQSTEVDLVSGATYSSKGILNAIKNALLEAEKVTNGSGDGTAGDNNGNGNGTTGDNGGTGSEGGTTGDGGGTGSEGGTTGDGGGTGSEGGTTGDSGEIGSGEGETGGTADTIYQDGTYQTTIWCYPDDDRDFTAYILSMTVTIENDKITSITEVSGDGALTNSSYIRRALNGTSTIPGVGTQIVEKGTLEDIDMVSRATCTSKSIIEGCQQVLDYAGKTTDIGVASR